jgi:hypothetical protein
MHNIALIRQICGRVGRETDEGKIEQLLLLLNAVILNDLEQVHMRTEYVRRKYAISFGQTTANDMPDGGES